MIYERHVDYTFLRGGKLVELATMGEHGNPSAIGWFEQDWQGLWIWRRAWDPPRWYNTGARTLLRAIRDAGLWDALKVIRSRRKIHVRGSFERVQ